MRIEDSVKLDYKDVLIRPKRSTLVSRREVDLVREFHFKHSPVKYSGIPIMAANMDHVGVFDMAKELSSHKLFTCLVKHYTLDDWKDNMVLDTGADPALEHVAISTGISQDDLARAEKILRAFEGDLNYICIDVANGYTEAFVSFISRARDMFKDHVIIAGNVVTADMVEALVLAGADIVKVGIGPGSVCTTRKKTGVGYPQLSAVIECADAAHGLGAHIVADGGCQVPGDVAKAFGAGADFVMLGGMLAGHKEGGGTVFAGRRQFYGMSSATAQEKHGDSLKGYRASEGKRVSIPDRGNVANTIQDILGGVRSACTYTGSTKLKELSKRTTFVRVSQQTNDVYGSSTKG